MKRIFSILSALALVCIIAGLAAAEGGSKDTAALKREYAALYTELQEFKGKSDFHAKGFGAGGAYAPWLARVDKADEGYDGMAQLQTGLIFGDLRQMGMDYMRSKGAETEYTEYMNKEVKAALEQP